jgi:prepilin peptidase CpaA
VYVYSFRKKYAMTGSVFIAGLISFFGLLLLLAAYNDFRKYLIPDWISIAVAATYAVYQITIWTLGAPEAASNVGSNVMAALATAGVVFVLFLGLFAKGAIGGGDVKLITAASLWAGPNEILPLLLVTAVVGGLLGIGVLLGRRISQQNPAEGTKALKTPIPYGIAIAAGGLVVAGQIFIEGAF